MAKLVKVVPGVGSVSGPDASEVSDVRKAIVAAGLSILGTPYLWGGKASADVENPVGLDCSGYSKWCCEHGGVSIPEGSRNQAAACQSIDAADALPGDLIFKSKDGSAEGVHHVGVVLDSTSVMEAPATGYLIRVAKRWVSKPGDFVFYGRPEGLS